MTDPYDDQLKAARYRAERDQARQELSRLRGEATTMSAYDLLTEEDREALRWVRKKGGLDAVRQRWERLSCYADTVPRSCMEKRLARLQRQVDESHAALRRRNQRISLLESEINRAHNENRMEFLRRAGNYTAFADEACKRLAPQLRYVEGCTKDVMDAALEALDSRLMPEGMQWPRYEGDELVRFGDIIGMQSGLWMGHPADEMVFRADGSVEVFGDGNSVFFERGEKARRIVLAADGEPLEIGQTVWHKSGLACGVVETIDAGSLMHTTRYRGDDGTIYRDAAKELVHKRPDSWERIEADCEMKSDDYARERMGMDLSVPARKSRKVDMMRDLVRRCKALAERDAS